MAGQIVPMFSAPSAHEREALDVAASYLKRAGTEAGSWMMGSPSLDLGKVELIESLRNEMRESAALCECLIDIVAALFSVSSKELRKAGRTAEPVSRVRQIAMYVAHVILRLTQGEVGRGFGRDRTTVVHACRVIEDMRDDPEFDRVVAMVERVADAAFRARLGL